MALGHRSAAWTQDGRRDGDVPRRAHSPPGSRFCDPVPLMRQTTRTRGGHTDPVNRRCTHLLETRRASPPQPTLFASRSARNWRRALEMSACATRLAAGLRGGGGSLISPNERSVGWVYASSRSTRRPPLSRVDPGAQGISTCQHGQGSSVGADLTFSLLPFVGSQHSTPSPRSKLKGVKRKESTSQQATRSMAGPPPRLGAG